VEDNTQRSFGETGGSLPKGRAKSTIPVSELEEAVGGSPSERHGTTNSLKAFFE
jgi:hypothetical protein